MRNIKKHREKERKYIEICKQCGMVDERAMRITIRLSVSPQVISFLMRHGWIIENLTPRRGASLGNKTEPYYHYEHDIFETPFSDSYKDFVV